MKLLKIGLVIGWLAYFTLACQCFQKQVAGNKAPYLVVISLDGFRWDYQDLYQTPCLDSIEQIGVKASSLQASFPSKTFPNHYTIATGMYPDHHGLVSNSYYSPAHQAIYKINDRSKVGDGTYYGGEPIWVSAENQGLKTACYFWVGSEADVQGLRPSIWKEYDRSVSYSARIDSVITWLQLPCPQRPNLCMLYFDEPDRVGHHYGPQSDSTRKVVEQLDGYLRELTTKLNQLSIKDSVNVIIVSDHGMGAVSKERYHVINDVIDTSMLDYALGSNPVYMVQAKPSFHQEIKEQFNRLQGITARDKSEMPKYLHYGTNENIAPLVVVADSAWSISLTKPGKYTGGAHGYDPTNKDMHGIFYAFGPSFKNAYSKSTFENIHIYNLMCQLLGVQPAVNDGDSGELKDILN